MKIQFSCDENYEHGYISYLFESKVGFLTLQTMKEKSKKAFPELIGFYSSTEYGPIYWKEFFESLKKEEIKKIIES